MRRFPGLAALLAAFWTPIPPKGPSYSRLYLRLRTPAGDNPPVATRGESAAFFLLMVGAVALVSLVVVIIIVSL